MVLEFRCDGFGGSQVRAGRVRVAHPRVCLAGQRVQIRDQGWVEVGAAAAQGAFGVLHDEPALIEVERLVGQQRHDVSPELAVAGRFRQPQCDEQVPLSEGLLVGVVGTDAGEGGQPTDGPVQLPAELVVVGGA
jgi:hypothetical protein